MPVKGSDETFRINSSSVHQAPHRIPLSGEEVRRRMWEEFVRLPARHSQELRVALGVNSCQWQPKTAHFLECAPVSGQFWM